MCDFKNNADVANIKKTTKYIQLKDGLFYDINDLQYLPRYERSMVLPFQWSRIDDLTILQDYHGSPSSWKTLYDILSERKNVHTIYLEQPYQHQSIIDDFMFHGMSNDVFLSSLKENICGKVFNPVGSGCCAAFVKVLQLARDNDVRVLCIDDWSNTSCFVFDRIGRNHRMATTINKTYISSSVLVVGGYHAEGLFALQHMILPTIKVSVMATDQMFHISQGLLVSFTKRSDYIDFDLRQRDEKIGRAGLFVRGFGKFSISNLYIEPEHGRHGYGALLYQQVEKYIIQRCNNHVGNFEIILSATFDSRLFWKRMGFTGDERQGEYYSMSKVVIG
jgi:hypothetical protein